MDEPPSPRHPERDGAGARGIERELDGNAEAHRNGRAECQPGAAPLRPRGVEREGEQPQRHDRAGILVLGQDDEREEQAPERKRRAPRGRVPDGIEAGPEQGAGHLFAALQPSDVVAEDAQLDEREQPVAQEAVPRHDVAVRQLSAEILRGRQQRVTVLEDVHDPGSAHHRRRGHRRHAAGQEQHERQRAHPARHLRPAGRRGAQASAGNGEGGGGPGTERNPPPLPRNPRSQDRRRGSQVRSALGGAPLPQSDRHQRRRRPRRRRGAGARRRGARAAPRSPSRR